MSHSLISTLMVVVPSPVRVPVEAAKFEFVVVAFFQKESRERASELVNRSIQGLMTETETFQSLAN